MNRAFLSLTILTSLYSLYLVGTNYEKITQDPVYYKEDISRKETVKKIQTDAPASRKTKQTHKSNKKLKTSYIRNSAQHING